MAVDTLAYAKALEAAGLDRRDAEAQVAALAQHVLPEIVTKADLDQRLEQLEHRLIRRMDRLGHDLTVRIFTFTLAIVGLMDAVLFALLRVVH
jgi:hypothetical protein